MYQTRGIQAVLTAAATGDVACLQFGLTLTALAGADPAFSFYGYKKIVPDPNPAITNENTHITVTVTNRGDQPATNVRVKLSYNDWGVTFQGWQEIDEVTISSIPANNGTADAEFDYVFENRAQCLEALIVSADGNIDLNNDRGQINMEVVNAGDSFDYNVPIVNNGDEDIRVGVVVWVDGRCPHDNPAGTVNDRCRPVEEVVPAGGEVFVPVHVEFPVDTPRDMPIEIEVLAFDFDDPFNSATMNHVRFQVFYNTPRGLMEDCLAELDALPPLPSPGKGKNRTVW